MKTTKFDIRAVFQDVNMKLNPDVKQVELSNLAKFHLDQASFAP